LHEQAAAEAARHAADSESLTELVAEARRKMAEARAARAAVAAAAEQQRKERQRQRKAEEAKEALRGAMALMEETAGARGVDGVEEAMRAAAKHAGRSESLAELVAEARVLIEQARAAAAAAAATAAAERLRLEQELAALTLSVQSETLRLQQVQAQLGVSPAAPARQAEEELCVVCLDAPKDHIIIPCGHQCVCGACAQALKREANPACPLCREPISVTTKVFG
jgi:hypothetical protein